MVKLALKMECIQLREKGRKSFREINEITGVSKGTLSGWLKDYPLTEAELKDKIQEGRKSIVFPKWKPVLPESDLYKKWANLSRSRLQKAKIAETAVLLRLLLAGFNVFGSAFDGDKVDWMVEVPSSGRVDNRIVV